MEKVHEDSGGRSPIRRPGASKDERRQQARVALHRVDWLKGPVVYWSGTAPHRETVQGTVFRAIPDLLGRRLLGMPAGIYAVRLGGTDSQAGAAPDALRALCRQVNPSPIEVRAVSEREISEAARALRGIGRHAEVLGELLHVDAERWRRQALEALPRLTAAFAAARRHAFDTAEALVIEEVCWWVGTDAGRPSRQISDATLSAWLTAGLPGTGCEIPGRQAGWLLAGQRRLRFAQAPEEARAWLRLGAALAAWPIDVLAHGVASRGSGGVSSWWSITRGARFSSLEAAAFLREAWWASGGNLTGVLPSHVASLGALHTAVVRAGQAWERRGHLVRGILLRAVERAQSSAGADRASVSVPEVAAAEVPGSDADDAVWVARVVDALRRRRLGGLAVERGTVVMRKLLGRLLRTRLGVAVDSGRLERVARALRGVGYGSGAGLFELCTELVAPEASTVAPEWAVTWAGLAGRLHGWGGREGTEWIPRWIEHLSDWVAPGRRLDRALKMALHLVELWAGASGRDPANLARLGQVLEKHAGRLVEWVHLEVNHHGTTGGVLRQQRVRWLLAHPVRDIARLGSLSEEDAGFLVRTGLLRRTVAIVHQRPDRLAAFVALARSLGADSENHVAGGPWPWLFASTTDAFLAWALGRRERWVSSGFLAEGQVAFVLSELVEAMEDRRDLGDFLVRHTGLVDRVLEAASRQPAEVPTGEAREFWADLAARFSRQIKVFELACAWSARGFAQLDRLMDTVLRWWAEVEERLVAGSGPRDDLRYLAFPGWTVDSVLEISGGDPARVVAVLSLATAPWFRWEFIGPGWRYLASIPGALDLVWAAWDGKPGARQALELVGRFGLGTRLWIVGELDHGAAAWSRAEGASERGAWAGKGLELPAEQVAELARIAAHRKLAGTPGSLPSELQALLDRPARLREERARLKAMLVAVGGGGGSAARRLANLEERLRDPVGLARWLAKDLRRALPKALFRARWESLNAWIDRGLRRHWRRQFAVAAPEPFDDDWHNALLLGSELTDNRALWRRLVRHEAAGDRDWRWIHPGNRKWLEQARAVGIDTERWLGPHQWAATGLGEPWRIHAEGNPLRVLQMGNWFDTCLQRSGVNNFSTVANAVEANKRVLYLTNAQGSVTGRKLVSLVLDDGRGVLIGFRSYGGTVGWHELASGKAAGPWTKIRFDLSCARLARSVGAWLPDSNGEGERLASQCALFAKWYNDGAETFDWWVAGRRFWSGNSDEPDRDAVLIEAVGRLDLEKWDARLATWRALVWLGEHALPFWSGFDPDTLSKAERRHLAPTAATLGLRW